MERNKIKIWKTEIDENLVCTQLILDRNNKNW